jgi:hypothetical protein
LPTGTAWSGEVSYRPNAPVQLNTTDILFAGVRPLGGALSNASVLNGVPGQDLHGYNRKEITQLQTTLTHFFDQVMGASRLTLVGEVGVTHVGGLESRSEARYGRDPVFGPGELPATGGLNTCSQILNTSTINGAGPGRRAITCPQLQQRRFHHLDLVGLSRSCDLGLQRRVRRCEPQAERGLVA